VAAGAAVLAVCAGLQLLGEYFPTAGTPTYPGAGLLDLRTAPGEQRTVGDLVVDTAAALGIGLLFGYENHGGRTTLGADLRPLGGVRRGRGNGGAQGEAIDGARAEIGAGVILATYLHGPVLAQNPALADLLLDRFLPAGETGPGADPAALARADHASAALRRARARQTGVRGPT
jgi:CobQ-like glutamine amidotransferase family enzyme